MKTTEKLWTKNFICITIANFFMFFGFEMFMTTIPLYINTIGGSSTDVGLSVGIFTFAALIMRVFAGYLLDRYGRRAVFICGLILMAAITLSYSLITSVAMIMLARMIHGIGWGVASTGSNTIASDNIPKLRFGEGMGYFGLSTSLAMAVGPAFGLTLLSHFDFNFLFIFAAATAITAIIISVPVKKVEFQNDINAAMEDAKYKPVIAEPKALIPAITIAFISASYGAVIGFIALFGIQKGIENIGFYFAVYAVVMLITRPSAGKLADKKGFAVVILPGIAFALIGILILSTSQDLWQFLISAAFYGIGMGATQPSLQALAVLRSPKDRTGAANATFINGFDLGIGVGSVTGGMLASAFGFSIMYMIFSGLIAVSAIFFLLFKNDLNYKR